MAKTTTDLLTNIKRRAQLPDDGGTLSDSDILAFASDELQNVVAPKLMAANEWHYAYSYTQTVTSSRSYRINYRTAGNSIISVEYYDGTNYRFINQRHPLLQQNPSVTAENFAIYGNNIVLSDGCPTSGTLRIRALLRPSSLVTTGCFLITASNPAAIQIVISSTASFTNGQAVDLQYLNSPYENYCIATANVFDATHLDLTISTPSITVPQLNTDTATLTLQVCPAETSDRVMLPDELHDYLAQRVAVRCMEARGFTQDMQNHLRKLADLEASFGRLTQPRAKGDFKVILPEEYFFAGRP